METERDENGAGSPPAESGAVLLRKIAALERVIAGEISREAVPLLRYESDEAYEESLAAMKALIGSLKTGAYEPPVQDMPEPLPLSYADMAERYIKNKR